MNHAKTKVFFSFLLLPCLLLGCNLAREDSEESARKYLDSQMRSWMVNNKESKALPFDINLRSALPPVDYQILSSGKGKPNANDVDEEHITEDWLNWTAFKFEVVVHWTSEQFHPSKAIGYNLMWHPHKKEWSMRDIYVHDYKR